MRKNLFKNNSSISKYQDLINQLNVLENDLKSITDNELRAKNFKLKKKYEEDKNLNN